MQHTEQYGKVERVWDKDPYKVRKSTTYIVIGDNTIYPLAYADPEETKPYLIDAQVPVIWYMTNNTIAMQGQILFNIAVKDAVKMGRK